MKHTLFASAAGGRLVMALAACALLVACATEPPVYQAAIQAPPLPVSVQPASSAAALPQPVVTPDTVTPLEYYAWALAATPQELQAEQLRLTTGGNREDPEIATVRLGILTSLPALATPGSEQAAIALLETVNVQNVSAGSRDYALFAAFLLSHLRQREDLRAANASASESREELEALASNNRQLQEKIEALTSIEEQLIQREQAEVQAAGQAEGQAPGAQR